MVVVIFKYIISICYISLAFNLRFRPNKKKQVGTMANIDISSLIQYIGVLQVNCKDPRKYFGYDLVQEAASRLDEVTHTAPTYGALVMSKFFLMFLLLGSGVFNLL